MIDRQTRSSDNLRWAGHWAGGVGETVLLELGQVGSAFDTVKVYIDCYRGAAAVCAGLLPGAVVVLRRVERLVSRGSGQLYCRFLPCSELSLGWGGVMESTVAGMSADEEAAWLACSVARVRRGSAGGSGQGRSGEGSAVAAATNAVDEGWVESRPRRYLSELVAPPATAADVDAGGEAAAAAGRRRARRRGPVVHVVARCDRLLKVEMYWQCAGCGQRLPGAPPGEDEAE